MEDWISAVGDGQGKTAAVAGVQCMSGNDRIERQKLEAKYKSLIEVNPLLNRKLVSFQASKDTAFYNWFAFKEGFSSEVVRMFLREYQKKRGRILDPFCGSATTLFAANEMCFDSLGIELLPIGRFILESRIAANKVNIEKLRETARSLMRIDFSKSPTDSKTDFKHIPITEQAFSHETEQKLNAFLKYIDDNVEGQNIRQILRFACFCILEKISYTRKDGQYLRWDYRARKSRATFSKGKVCGFEEAIFGMLERILSDLSSYHLFFGRSHFTDAKIEMDTGSCLEIMPLLPEESYDLVISSPPYCNRYDYTRTYALELAFLGIGKEEIKKLRQSLLSCTVENKDKHDFLRAICKTNKQVDLFNHAESAFKCARALQEVVEILGKYKVQKKLNNPGIYRMVKNYFYEHAFVVFQMARLLKKGGRVYYVNDNVRYAGETIPVDLILSEFAREAGLEVKKIFVLPNAKGNSSQQMGVHGREELRKCVYYWEKPKC